MSCLSFRLALIAFTATNLISLAHAQSGTLRVAIGTVRSQRQCTLYAVTSGSEQMYGRAAAAGVASPFGAAAAGSAELAYKRQWRMQLVRDCVSNFAALRQSLQAALASSGHVVVVPAGTRGAYTLTADIFAPGTTAAQYQSADVGTESEDAALSLQFSLRDPRGQVVHGNLITKRLNLSNNSTNGIVDVASSMSGNAIYAQLQRDAALAIARSVAFKLDPLIVVETAGQRAKLNYGAPFVAMGATVYLQGPGGEQIKGNVASALNGSAWIETYGAGQMGAVQPGSLANFVEADDPAANGRLYERVDLP